VRRGKPRRQVLGSSGRVRWLWPVATVAAALTVAGASSFSHSEKALSSTAPIEVVPIDNAPRETGGTVLPPAAPAGDPPHPPPRPPAETTALPDMTVDEPRDTRQAAAPAPPPSPPEGRPVPKPRAKLKPKARAEGAVPSQNQPPPGRRLILVL
jgi:hypothetical protein